MVAIKQNDNKEILITKRDGRKEPLNIEKLHKVVSFACQGISGVSVSEVELTSQIQFFNEMKTSDIQEVLIKAAAQLISEESPNYQYVAGRLISYQLRKNVYESFTPKHLFDHTKNIIQKGYYTKELLSWYTKEEFDKMDAFIDHKRDDNLTFAAMEQFRGKYLVQNRVTKEIFETPQIAYMLMAATGFHNYPKETRLQYVREFYDAISTHVISLPTPILAGLRTPQKQFSSCVLIESDDSLKSINATSSSIVNYISQKAGIGINSGRIRAIGSNIRKGDAVHTGVIPFLKHFQSAVKSCSQGGVRGGAATIYFPIWHLEIEDILVLKNNKGTEENRVRHMDYGIQINRLFYERFIQNKEITLFSPSDVPEIYEPFFNNYDKFKELYERAEKKQNIRKKVVKAIDLFCSLMTERKNTGRIYVQNVDHCNTHSPFLEDKEIVKMSNLCTEIGLPTNPLNSVDDKNGRIALCTLAATNMGKIESPEDLRKPCDLIIRFLDELLSYQEYPVIAAELATKEYRPLGVGVTNFAYWMAKNGLSYEGNKETYEMVDEFMEAMSYYLIRTSVDLAKEKGACLNTHNTKYSQGILPIHTYKKDVDSIVKRKYSMDWDSLAADAKKYGIRNATVMAIMPCESSSLLTNSTNGIEPPRSYMPSKGSKANISKQVIPGYPRLKNKYQLLWDIKDPEGYLKICAIIQKYTDQAMSINTTYNPKNYENEEIPMSLLIKHLLMHYKFGGKTLYYCQTEDDSGEIEINKENKTIIDSSCEGGACKL
jgi:ribonucleoside-diphosphate reductase alpha chain